MKIQIKGQSYEIKRKDVIDNNLGIEGQFIKINKTLLISKNADDIDNTILHELIHAFFYECGLIGECNDEDLVYWLAYHLPQIIKVFEKIKQSKLYKELKN